MWPCLPLIQARREAIINKTQITGVILAGGQSTRMAGRDKGLMDANGRPLYRHVLDRLSEQVGGVIINTNRHMDLYRQSGLPVITDTLPGFPGPLAGMLAGLTAAATPWVAFAPCDVPVFPHDLVLRLYEGVQDGQAAFASGGGRDHPAFALLNRGLIPVLELFLAGGERKVMLFFERIKARRVLFFDRPPSFHNLNTPLELQNWIRGQG